MWGTPHPGKGLSPLHSFLIMSPAAGERRVMWGDTPHPGKGLSPLHSFLIMSPAAGERRVMWGPDNGGYPTHWKELMCRVPQTLYPLHSLTKAGLMLINLF